MTRPKFTDGSPEETYCWALRATDLKRGASWPEVVRALRAAIRGGDHFKAANTLGVCCEFGYGTRRSVKLAEKYYAMAGDAGNEYAIFNLGVLHDGFPARKRKKLAFDCYLRAAKTGDVKSMTNLAIMYGNGDGVRKNRRMFLFWSRRAAAQGDH